MGKILNSSNSTLLKEITQDDNQLNRYLESLETFDKKLNFNEELSVETVQDATNLTDFKTHYVDEKLPQVSSPTKTDGNGFTLSTLYGIRTKNIPQVAIDKSSDLVKLSQEITSDITRNKNPKLANFTVDYTNLIDMTEQDNNSIININDDNDENQENDTNDEEKQIQTLKINSAANSIFATATTFSTTSELMSEQALAQKDYITLDNQIQDNENDMEMLVENGNSSIEKHVNNLTIEEQFLMELDELNNNEPEIQTTQSYNKPPIVSTEEFNNTQELFTTGEQETISKNNNIAIQRVSIYENLANIQNDDKKLATEIEELSQNGTSSTQNVKNFAKILREKTKTFEQTRENTLKVSNNTTDTGNRTNKLGLQNLTLGIALQTTGENMLVDGLSLTQKTEANRFITLGKALQNTGISEIITGNIATGTGAISTGIANMIQAITQTNNSSGEFAENVIQTNQSAIQEIEGSFGFGIDFEPDKNPQNEPAKKTPNFEQNPPISESFEQTNKQEPEEDIIDNSNEITPTDELENNQTEPSQNEESTIEETPQLDLAQTNPADDTISKENSNPRTDMEKQPLSLNTQPAENQDFENDSTNSPLDNRFISNSLFQPQETELNENEGELPRTNRLFARFNPLSQDRNLNTDETVTPLRNRFLARFNYASFENEQPLRFRLLNFNNNQNFNPNNGIENNNIENEEENKTTVKQTQTSNQAAPTNIISPNRELTNNNVVQNSNNEDENENIIDNQPPEDENSDKLTTEENISELETQETTKQEAEAEDETDSPKIDNESRTNNKNATQNKYEVEKDFSINGSINATKTTLAATEEMLTSDATSLQKENLLNLRLQKINQTTNTIEQSEKEAQQEEQEQLKQAEQTKSQIEQESQIIKSSAEEGDEAQILESQANIEDLTNDLLNSNNKNINKFNLNVAALNSDINIANTSEMELRSQISEFGDIIDQQLKASQDTIALGGGTTMLGAAHQYTGVGLIALGQSLIASAKLNPSQIIFGQAMIANGTMLVAQGIIENTTGIGATITGTQGIASNILAQNTKSTVSTTRQEGNSFLSLTRTLAQVKTKTAQDIVNEENQTVSDIITIGASASANANSIDKTETNDKLDNKLTRFNTETEIESRKKRKKVNAVSSSSRN